MSPVRSGSKAFGHSESNAEIKKKMILKKVSRQQKKSMENYPACYTQNGQNSIKVCLL